MSTNEEGSPPLLPHLPPKLPQKVGFSYELSKNAVQTVQRTDEVVEKLNKTLEIKINKVRHQYKNSECGMYCIYFITSLLDGKSFKNVVQTIVDDDTMNGKRDEFFNKIS